MADDVDITPGTGATVRADEVDGKLVQFVKLMDGTSDGSGQIPGSATRGLVVDPKRIGFRQIFNPTFSTSQYTAKDVMGTTMTLADVARAAGGVIVIDKVVVVDRDQEMKGMDLVVWGESGAVTVASDNAVFDPADSELDAIQDVIPITPGDYADFNDNAVAVVRDIGSRIVCASDDAFAVLVCRAPTGPTLTANTDIRVIISGWSE